MHKKIVDRYVTESSEFQDMINGLEDRMTKQARTIQVQSDTISAPRNVHHALYRDTKIPSRPINPQRRKTRGHLDQLVRKDIKLDIT